MNPRLPAKLTAICCGFWLISLPSLHGAESRSLEGVRVGTFAQEVRTAYAEDEGLPSRDVWGVVVGGDGAVYAGTTAGLARFDGTAWRVVGQFSKEIPLMAPTDKGVLVLSDSSLYRCDQSGASELVARCDKPELKSASFYCLTAAGNSAFVGTSQGVYEVKDGQLVLVPGLNQSPGWEPDIRQIAVRSNGNLVVAAKSGLFGQVGDFGWTPIYPRSGHRSWAPYDVRGVAYDTRGRLWFASVQGVGCLDGDEWTLYTGYEGLPYNDFTTVAAGEDGVVWFGTRIGAIRFDGQRWSYRQGLRWLPHDEVRAIAVSAQGEAWFATAEGVSRIERRPTTLAQKAAVLEEAIDKHHRRTPYGYVLSVSLNKPGDASQWTQRDSDNDGLWTSMYGAGECFAYAATKDPKAKQRATAAFEAVRFLSEVTQGGTHPAPRGFPARTILPTDGEDPNAVAYAPERDRERQRRDPLWKVIVPRWPKSADGKWYWKCDTSSDELDGHYFLYAVYYDLVAETEAEKARAREVVLAITDHLIDHDFQLVDHDGLPTRWARFSPKELNGGLFWPGRGLNSLSVLSYLKVAEHVSGGGAKYREAYDRLVREHSYATNVTDPKLQNGPGSGNQSDDEMAFMCFYNLLNYEKDARLRSLYRIALLRYWALERPEACPLFNYLFAALYTGEAARGVPDFGILVPRIPRSCLEDAADTLIRYPLDRFNWGYRNSHRLDIQPLPNHLIDNTRRRAARRDGTCLPIDERFVEYWNHDPWTVDSAGDGRTLADGASFLLPYYLGLYHGFIQEEG